jgi:hypothetical protein
MVEQQNPERFKQLMADAQEHLNRRFAFYENLAKVAAPKAENGNGGSHGNGNGGAPAATATEARIAGNARPAGGATK